MILKICSLYEFQGEEDESYKPPCDLEENISCSVMFNSQYGTGFGLVSRLIDYP